MINERNARSVVHLHIVHVAVVRVQIRRMLLVLLQALFVSLTVKCVTLTSGCNLVRSLGNGRSYALHNCCMRLCICERMLLSRVDSDSHVNVEVTCANIHLQ